MADSFSNLRADRVLVVDPDERHVFKNASATAYTGLKGDCFWVRIEGRYCVELAESQVALAGAAVAQQKVRFFIDAEELQGYDSDARNLLTKWCVTHLGDLAEVHILSGVRIVSMGVAVANIALSGTLEAHETWDAFRAAFHESQTQSR